MSKKNGTREFTSLAQLTSDPKNARRHTPRNVGTIVDALHEVGAARSIVIDENGVVLAGNATMDAAIEAGLSKVQVVDGDGETVIAVRRKGLTAEQKTRLALYDNRAAELAEWNPEILSELAPEELQGMFSDKELAEILSQTGVEPKDVEVNVDKAVELQQKWQVATGEIIEIGKHRLMCGDSSSSKDCATLLKGKRVTLCFTSPPYNLGGRVNSGFPQKGGMWNGAIAKGYEDFDDDLPHDEFKKWQAATLTLIWNEVLSDDGAIYYNHRPRCMDKTLQTALDWNPGLPVRQIVIWDSSAGVNCSPTHYRVTGEWIVIFAKRGFSLESRSASVCGDIWKIPPADRVDGHPAPFPKELPMRALETSGAQTVYDPFIGSGTTMVAAQNLGRQCFAMDISPGYCSIVLERMSTAFPHLKIERVDKAA